tara:strand:- start:580 stop:834 length:255 start_codon:yes stop_codon:yes gene_type:complete
MRKFAKQDLSWLNKAVKNTSQNIKEKIISGYLEEETPKETKKNPDINVLLNRVKSDQKNESRKKLYFSAIASTGLILFGLVIFQ